MPHLLSQYGMKSCDFYYINDLFYIYCSVRPEIISCCTKPATILTAFGCLNQKISLKSPLQGLIVENIGSFDVSTDGIANLT